MQLKDKSSEMTHLSRKLKHQLQRESCEFQSELDLSFRGLAFEILSVDEALAPQDIVFGRLYTWLEDVLTPFMASLNNGEISDANIDELQKIIGAGTIDSCPEDLRKLMFETDCRAQELLQKLRLDLMKRKLKRMVERYGILEMILKRTAKEHKKKMVKVERLTKRISHASGDLVDVQTTWHEVKNREWILYGKKSQR